MVRLQPSIGLKPADFRENSQEPVRIIRTRHSLRCPQLASAASQFTVWQSWVAVFRNTSNFDRQIATKRLSSRYRILRYQKSHLIFIELKNKIIRKPIGISFYQFLHWIYALMSIPPVGLIAPESGLLLPLRVVASLPINVLIN